MSAGRLIKYAPSAILIAFLGYASYSLQAALPGAAEKEGALAKGLDLMLKELVASNPAGDDGGGQLRNPFLAVKPPAPEVAEPVASAAPGIRRRAGRGSSRASVSMPRSSRVETSSRSSTARSTTRDKD